MLVIWKILRTYEMNNLYSLMLIMPRDVAQPLFSQYFPIFLKIWEDQRFFDIFQGGVRKKKLWRTWLMCTETWHFQPIVAFKSAAHIKKSYYYVLGYYVYDIVNFVGGNQCWKTKFGKRSDTSNCLLWLRLLFLN